MNIFKLALPMADGRLSNHANTEALRSPGNVADIPDPARFIEITCFLNKKTCQAA